jgi:hypothetical protein
VTYQALTPVKVRRKIGSTAAHIMSARYPPEYSANKGALALRSVNVCMMVSSQELNRRTYAE